MTKRYITILMFLFFLTLCPLFSQDNPMQNSLAIMPFNYPSGMDTNLVNTMNTFFRSKMVEKGNGNTTFVERQKINLIIQEQKLQMTGLFDDAQASTIGSMTGASHIVLGEIGYTDNTYSESSISINIIEVKSGNIVYSNFKISEIHSPSVLYWLEQLVNEYYGFTYNIPITEEATPSIIVHLPLVPPANKGILVRVEDYENLQKRINKQVERENYKEALSLLDDLSDLYKNDAGNSFFRNNPEDMAYLRSIDSWQSVSYAEVGKAYIGVEVAKAIELITEKRGVYTELMRNHTPSTAPEARAIRWNEVLDVLESYDNTEGVLKHPLVVKTYGNVFHLLLDGDRRDHISDVDNENSDREREAMEKKQATEDRRRAITDVTEGIWEFFFPYGWNGDFYTMAYSDITLFSGAYNQETAFSLDKLVLYRYNLYMLNPSIFRLGLGTTLFEMGDVVGPSVFPLRVSYPLYFNDNRNIIDFYYVYHWNNIQDYSTKAYEVGLEWRVFRFFESDEWNLPHLISFDVLIGLKYYSVDEAYNSDIDEFYPARSGVSLYLTLAGGTLSIER
ncbi:MAG: hypothetical protein KAQ93_04585 [Spirochaetales bacterium]|nr:hypothetical protein [Spirochaetales bacterium]